jgi:hypothetical protein
MDTADDNRTIGSLQELLDQHGIPYTVEPCDNPEFDGGKKLVTASPFEPDKTCSLYVRRGFCCHWDASGKERKFKDFCRAHGIGNPNKVKKLKGTAEQFHKFLCDTFSVARTPAGVLHVAYRMTLKDESGNVRKQLHHTEIVNDDFAERAVGMFSFSTDKLISRADKNKAIDVWKAVRRLSAPIQELHHRSANFNGGIAIDVGDDACRQIFVGADGWIVREFNPLLRFLRDKNARPLVLPELGGRVQLLERYLNVGYAFPLVAAWIIYAMRPPEPRIIPPVLCLNGGAGSGKTSIVLVAREFTDPKPGRMLPQQSNSVRDQMVAAQTERVVVLNNITKLTKEYSDFICRLPSGSARLSGSGNSFGEISMSNEYISAASLAAALEAQKSELEQAHTLERDQLLHDKNVLAGELRDARSVSESFQTGEQGKLDIRKLSETKEGIRTVMDVRRKAMSGDKVAIAALGYDPRH